MIYGISGDPRSGPERPRMFQVLGAKKLPLISLGGLGPSRPKFPLYKVSYPQNPRGGAWKGSVAGGGPPKPIVKLNRTLQSPLFFLDSSDDEVELDRASASSRSRDGSTTSTEHLRCCGKSGRLSMTVFTSRC